MHLKFLEVVGATVLQNPTVEIFLRLNSLYALGARCAMKAITLITLGFKNCLGTGLGAGVT